MCVCVYVCVCVCVEYAIDISTREVIFLKGKVSGEKLQKEEAPVLHTHIHTHTHTHTHTHLLRSLSVTLPKPNLAHATIQI